MDDLPSIAILGAGPIGLEATLYARYLGYPVELFERGKTPAANVSAWGQVSLFTPFGMNATPLAVAAMQAQNENWECPAAGEFLTGNELLERYWLPLAQSDLVRRVTKLETEVLAIGRQGWLKREGAGNEERSEDPFSLLLRHADGSETTTDADIVIDCTGTYGNHNWLGQGGTPAPGETAAAAKIKYGLPDVLGTDKADYEGKQTLVVGAGYSAATVITQLAQLTGKTTWLTRGEDNAPIQRIADDRLGSRDELAEQANALVADDSVEYFPATAIEAIEYRAATDDFEVTLSGEQTGSFVYDRIIANVGYRPDNKIYSELHVHECYASGGPMKLAAQLANQAGDGPADCLNQTVCGPDSLRTPEPDFYILGSKSYGRSSQFLLSIGLTQIRDLFTIIGAREDLDLYATMPPLK